MRAVTEEFKLFCPFLSPFLLKRGQKDGGGKKDTKTKQQKAQLYWTKIKTKRNQTNQIKNPTGIMKRQTNRGQTNDLIKKRGKRAQQGVIEKETR